MRFDLRIPYLVIISPNAAFARIKDGNGMYFGQAVVIFLIGAILGAVITSSHIFIGQLELSSQASLWWQMISILTSGVTLPVIIHIAGKIFGGNRCWKLTFDAIFHIHVLYILLAAVLFGLVGTFWSYYSIPFDLSAPSIAPDFFSSISFLYNVVSISLENMRNPPVHIDKFRSGTIASHIKCQTRLIRSCTDWNRKTEA